MRLPAARRFAATILRATIAGSNNFISILLQMARAMGRFYRTSDRRIFLALWVAERYRSLEAWKDEDRGTRVLGFPRNIMRKSVEPLLAPVCALAKKQRGTPACVSCPIRI